MRVQNRLLDNLQVMNALEQAEIKVANMEQKLAHFMNQTEKDLGMLEVENEDTLT